MTLSILPNPLVKKKSFNASFSSKCTTSTITAPAIVSENQHADQHAEKDTNGTKEMKKEADELIDNVASSTPNPPLPPPPHHGYSHPGYPGMMPMAPGMGMHPMFMMPPMPMGCYSYNCGPFPQAYGRSDGGSRCSSRRSGGWFYGGHPDITEIDVEDGVSFDSRDSCATLMCVEPLEQAGQLITKVLDSWANNVNTAMDYGENLCHPIDTNQTDESNAVRKESGLSETLLNLVKGQEGTKEETVITQNEKNVEANDKVKVEENVQKLDEVVKTHESKAIDNKSKEDDTGDIKGISEKNDGAEKVKQVQPVGFLQRMKNMNPLKTLDMSAISKDSEVNDLSRTLDDNVVISETKTEEPESATRNLTRNFDMKATEETSQKHNYFSNEISFEFSPEGVSIQEIANEVQPEAQKVDTNPIKVTSVIIEPQPPIVSSTIRNAKNVFNRPEKKMIKFPRMNSRYAKLGAKEELKSVEGQPFSVNFPADVSLDSNGFPLLSKHNSKSSTWECPFDDSNLFAGKDSIGISSPVSVAAVLEMRSCAWCGKGGNDTAAARKLKLCSACQSTYYCSAACQSKDWIDGHSKTCQPII